MGQLSTEAMKDELRQWPRMAGLLLVWTLAAVSLLYLLPTAIAFTRSHKDTLSVFLVNLFLGWTLIGWIVSLVWAVKSMKP